MYTDQEYAELEHQKRVWMRGDTQPGGWGCLLQVLTCGYWRAWHPRRVDPQRRAENLFPLWPFADTERYAEALRSPKLPRGAATAA